MGTGTSPMGRGGGGGKSMTPVGNSTLTQTMLNKKADDYAKQMAVYQSRLNSNPNNTLYRDERLNYGDLATAARGMNPGAAQYSGIDSIIALDASPMGTTVNIQGITFSGNYTKQRMRTVFGSGDVWSDSSGHAFATNTGTLMSSLN